MTFRRIAVCTLVTLAAVLSDRTGFADQPAASVLTFLRMNCYDCHSGEGSEAGFDLSELPSDFNDTDVDRWVRIFDRVHEGEMPPADYGELDPDERKQFLHETEKWLKTAQQREFQAVGRVRGKRLTNLQLERTLHDLLGIDIPLASRMPDEPRVSGFTTVADGQPMSHFQIEQHVDVIDAALDEAFRRALSREDDEWSKTLSGKDCARSAKRTRNREPELINGNAVTWSAGLVFYGRLPVTTASESGWYRMTVRSKCLNPPNTGTVWCTVRTGKCISNAPLMDWAGAYEAKPKMSEYTVEAWLPAEHMFEIRPGDINLKKGKTYGGQVETGKIGPQKVPGVAIESIKLQRIHKGRSNAEIRKMLFRELELKPSQDRLTVKPENPREEARRLMKHFARFAFRRPVDPETLEPYVAIYDHAVKEGQDFPSALQSGYRAILCSPRFLYLRETPGKLDEFAIASRLSYFLWNRMPDKRLFQLAREGKLQDPAVVRQQVERMLDDPKAKEFVKDFAHEWLDLRLINFTEPDPKLYPGFDTIVQNSMVDETHWFLQKMIDDDLSISHLIDANFTFLNSRLARYYDIDGVEGDEMRQVRLKPKHHRGGLLTQGAILKVTANGTTTSPVIRGVWVSERLLGLEIPPPPANISAIEPDIRGANTIREQLAKHKDHPSCASCHVKMDPPGFALENYDPSGRWRDNYIRLKGRNRVPGKPVDASSKLVSGKSFKDIEGFQSLILGHQETIAANVVEKLLTYGTGAPIAFVDRDAVEHCVSESKKSDYGFRSLIHAVVKCQVFTNK